VLNSVRTNQLKTSKTTVAVYFKLKAFVLDGQVNVRERLAYTHVVNRLSNYREAFY
jgi:hypothetical protein